MTAMSARIASADSVSTTEFDIPVALVDVATDHRKHRAPVLQAKNRDPVDATPHGMAPGARSDNEVVP